MPRRAAGLLLAACLALIAGCATRGPLLESPAGQVELTNTPFFPQKIHQCGPAALATVLGASGVAVHPDVLTPLVFLPGRRGSLQVEIQAAPRRYDRLPYPVAPELAAITAEVAAGRPVLVLHNYGLPFWPRWHYAVVVGFDAAKQKLVLRSGTRQREVQSAAHFMRAWDNGGRWGIVLLRPGELPAQPDRARYLEAATTFERTAPPPSARLTYEAAVRQWPEDPVGWVGRGTAHYRAGLRAEAAADYRQALALDGTLAAPRNNLAMTLLEMDCPASARREMAAIDDAALPPAMRAAVADTRAQIAARGDSRDSPGCTAPD